MIVKCRPSLLREIFSGTISYIYIASWHPSWIYCGFVTDCIEQSHIWDADLHLVPRSKNAWNYTSTLQYAYIVWFSVKARGNFTFTLIVVQLIMKFSSIYGIRSSLTVFTRAKNRTLCWASLIRNSPSCLFL